MNDAQGPLPSYVRPPVSEVVFGVQFAPITELLAPHTGRYWERIVGNYPKVEEHPQIGHAIEVLEESPPVAPQIEFMSKPELPRCWFMDSTETSLIQLQRDRFVYNWRKKNPADVYPRYVVLKELFLSQWKAFKDFLAQEDLPVPRVDQCELTYVNHVVRPDEWETVEDFSKVFSFWRWAPREDFLRVPDDVRMMLRWLLPENQGRLRAEMVPAKRTIDMADIVRFVLVARGRPHEPVTDASISEWFDLGHKWITRGFVDLTGRKTDEMWERET